MRTACFIIPYFGKLPNTFPIYLRTCAANPEYDWLIVTDDYTEYTYPPNVHVQYQTFDQFVERVQKHFAFPIGLKFSYKICDFRAAFGVIFAEELKEYRFWGHCDLDQYFGKIDHFISKDILDSYDKILCLGHFTLFRNVPDINQLYTVEDRTYHQSYVEVFSDEKHWIFDEWPTNDCTSINRIVKQEGVKVYYCHDCFCDLIPFVSRYQRYIFDETREDWDIEPVKNMVFVWENGCLYACHMEKGQLVKREMLYVHIRQRALKMDIGENDRVYYIVPNRIFTDDAVKDSAIVSYIHRARRRSLCCPDETARKAVILRGYWDAALRRCRQKYRKMFKNFIH